MKSNKTLYTIFALVLVVLFGSSACQKDTVAGETEVSGLSGEYWVEAEEFAGSFAGISMYNTAANTPSEMWLDDHFWGAKYKVAVDAANLTFTANNVANSDPEYDITIKITNGKIIKLGTKGPASAAATDSIYYEAEYSDDPGTVYHISGYRRTRYAEDDH